MARQHIDYITSALAPPNAPVDDGLDVGDDAAAAVRPVTDGEPAQAAVFTRPSENLRTRTEIIRDELEQLKFMSDADKAMLLTSSGSITWDGVYPGFSGNFVPTADLILKPFLAPSASTASRLIICANTQAQVTFRTKQTGLPGHPRAYSGANDITIDFQPVAVGNGTIFVTATGADSNRVHIQYDSHASTYTTAAADALTGLCQQFNVSAVALALGIEAVFEGGGVPAEVGFPTPPAFVAASRIHTYITGPEQATRYMAGAAEAEKHTITAGNLAAFFAADGGILNKLIEGDVLCIWYDEMVGLSYGGRRQSLSEAPESSDTIPPGSLFVLRRFPSRLPGALPIATVVNGQLIFINGRVYGQGEVGPLVSSGASYQGSPAAPNSWADSTVVAGPISFETALDTIIQTLGTKTGVTPGAIKVGFTPAGDIATNNVKAALEELDSKKASRALPQNNIFTNANTFTPSVATTTAVVATGNTTGRGVLGTGGTTDGTGVRGVGGATNGAGVEGQGTGTGNGVSGTGGAVDGTGVNGQGVGLGVGVNGNGGATGHGVAGTSGGTSGNGVDGTSVNGGVGVWGHGDGAGYGVRGTGGATGVGVHGLGQGNSAGVTGLGNGEGAGSSFSAGTNTNTGANTNGVSPVAGPGTGVVGIGATGTGGGDGGQFFGRVGVGGTASRSGVIGTGSYSQTTAIPGGVGGYLAGGAGTVGNADGGIGVVGVGGAGFGTGVGGSGVVGNGTGPGRGVIGTGGETAPVSFATRADGAGVYGQGGTTGGNGIVGRAGSPTNLGSTASSVTNTGVVGVGSTGGFGVVGVGPDTGIIGAGVVGLSSTTGPLLGVGVYGYGGGTTPVGGYFDTPGGGHAIAINTGHAIFNGGNVAAYASGLLNKQTPSNLIKAWGFLGVQPSAGTPVTMHASYGLSGAATISGQGLLIPFADAFSGAGPYNYSIVCTSDQNNFFEAVEWQIETTTATTAKVQLYWSIIPADGRINLSNTGITNTFRLHFIVTGNN